MHTVQWVRNERTFYVNILFGWNSCVVIFYLYDMCGLNTNALFVGKGLVSTWHYPIAMRLGFGPCGMKQPFFFSPTFFRLITLQAINIHILTLTFYTTSLMRKAILLHFLKFIISAFINDTNFPCRSPDFMRVAPGGTILSYKLNTLCYVQLNIQISVVIQLLFPSPLEYSHQWLTKEY